MCCHQDADRCTDHPGAVQRGVEVAHVLFAQFGFEDERDERDQQGAGYDVVIAEGVDLPGVEVEAGVVLSTGTAQIFARVEGEMWQVRSAAPLSAGQRIRVTGMEGLTLTVTPESPHSTGG